jgi:hypothetical protein
VAERCKYHFPSKKKSVSESNIFGSMAPVSGLLEIYNTGSKEHGCKNCLECCFNFDTNSFQSNPIVISKFFCCFELFYVVSESEYLPVQYLQKKCSKKKGGEGTILYLELQVITLNINPH